jgi:hypothetical protein
VGKIHASLPLSGTFAAAKESVRKYLVALVENDQPGGPACWENDLLIGVTQRPGCKISSREPLSKLDVIAGSFADRDR